MITSDRTKSLTTNHETQKIIYTRSSKESMSKETKEDLDIMGTKFCVVPDKLYWYPIKHKKKNKCQMEECNNFAFQTCSQNVDLIECGKYRFINFHTGCKKMFCPLHARIYMNKSRDNQSVETFCCRNCEDGVE